jgi:hypothetical protein
MYETNSNCKHEDIMKKLFNVGVVLVLITAVNLFSMQRYMIDVLQVYTMKEGVISREHVEEIEQEEAARRFQELVERRERQRELEDRWEENKYRQAEANRAQRRAKIANIRHGLYGNGY